MFTNGLKPPIHLLSTIDLRAFTSLELLLGYFEPLIGLSGSKESTAACGSTVFPGPESQFWPLSWQKRSKSIALLPRVKARSSAMRTTTATSVIIKMSHHTSFAGSLVNFADRLLKYPKNCRIYTSLVKFQPFHASCQFCTMPWKGLSESILS